METCLARFQGKLQAPFFDRIKLMKKLIAIIPVLALSLLLSGCEPKKATEDIAVPPSQNTAEPSATIEETNPAGGNTLTSSIDIASIDSAFNKNFSLAAEDAKKILGENSKFCFAKVSFLGGVVSARGEMNFFFEDDARISDYYWLVSFDSTKPDNPKKRYLAAKRDWGNITCTSLTAPPSFAKAYDNFATSGKLDTVTTLSAAKIDMTLINKYWKMELFNTSGELILSETEDTIAKPTDTTPPATFSPTPIDL